MPLKTITGPAATAIDASEVKAAGHIDGTEFDAQIVIAIAAATRLAQHRLGRRLINQTLELVIDEFPAAEIDLQIPGVQSIASVKYLEPLAGVETTLASDQYALDSESTPCWLLPAFDVGIWPETRDTVNAVRVRFVAGYGASSASVPQEIRQWMLFQAVNIVLPGYIKTTPEIDRLLDENVVHRCG